MAQENHKELHKRQPINPSQIADKSMYYYMIPTVDE